MYDLLIFDADHTLWDFDKAEKEAIKYLFVDIGEEFKETYLEIYRKINFKLWKRFELNELTQSEIKLDRFRLFFEALEINTNYEIHAEKFLEYLSKGQDLLSGAFDLIDDLAKRYKLALLTNGISKVQHPRYENSEIYGYFKAFVVSGDIGINKPSAKIFDLTIEKCGIIDRNKVLMIGDSLTSDIKGGLNAKINTCWFNPNKIKNNSDILPKFEIHELNELYYIIGEKQ